MMKMMMKYIRRIKKKREKKKKYSTCYCHALRTYVRTKLNRTVKKTSFYCYSNSLITI